VRILIADDNATNLKLLRATLEAEGHQVLVAEDGFAALAILEKEQVEAVLSDILMPRMDGYRFCIEVRKRAEFDAIPFIVYTSTYTSPSDEATALNLGADRFLKKPASAEEISQALKQAAKDTPRRRKPPGSSAKEDPMREYSERLVAKLEKKNSELQTGTELLVKSEAFNRAILDSAMDGILALDAQGKVIEFNHAAERSFGFSRADALGQDVAELIFPAAMRESRRKELKEVLDHKEKPTLGSRLEIVAMRKDGTEFPVELTITRVSGAEPARFTAFIRDLTEQKHTQQQLLLSATALKTAANAILITDGSGSILWVNPAFTTLTGYSLEEVSGKNPSLLKSGLHDSRFYEALWKKLVSGKTWHGEFTNRRKDGSLYCGEQTITPVCSEAGRTTHFVGIMNDVTERKRTEEETTRAREQLRALAARLQAAREEERIRISREMHDGMGEMLSGIEMNLAWMQTLIDEKNPRVQRQGMLEKIEVLHTLTHGAAERVRKLCTELRPSVLDDLGLVAALEWQVREFQARTKIRCEAKFDLEQLAASAEQATAIFRIFQEILTNVARHAQASKVRVALRKSDSNILLEIKDNGKGIRPEDMAGTKSLGLLGMKERAGLLGGKMEIAGAPGKGTRVSVTIPIAAGRSDSQ
jgi:PAS domain S-box-containing protein